ncbi:hypothetical protein QFC22_005304 [Naganishia vaughanmartiniae]|uniref:Uncharacterized protein n=1 Tax=Naganishia vaughanmartiniae TaxID=1424756 RepID=A0ACC2WV30_9TREE|nr:hypothetical protein QFC22_005304 [Naganishia vaughanmartiniae]
MTLSLRQEEPALDPSSVLSPQQSREQSIATWARDLQGIYEHAKERFADVKWVADVDGGSDDGETAEFLKDDNGAIAVDDVDAILSTTNERQPNDSDAIFGHKAIIYARAPKAFKDRYFPVSATGIPSNQSHGRTPAPARHAATSASTLNLHQQPQGTGATRSTSSFAFLPTETSWPNDDEANDLNQLSTCSRGVSTLSHHSTPEMLKQALEWLYTAKVPSEQDTSALEFITIGRSEDTGDEFAEEVGETQHLGLVSAKGVNGVDMVGAKTFKMGQLRLAQDLTYMWRSKLYTDIRIRICTPTARQNAPSDRLTRGPPSAFKIPSQGLRQHTSFSSIQVPTHSRSSTRNGNPEYEMDDVAVEGDEETMFSAHRFILCSRSPYFHQVLLNSGAFQSHPAAMKHDGSVDPDDIPEITLPSPPFTPLATYFTLGYLYSGSLSFSNKTFDLPTAFSITKAAMFLEVDSLVTELHAIIRDELCHGMRYPVFQNGKKMGGCACKKCIKRIPKVLRFAQAPDVQATGLKQDAVEYLTQGWAECWGKDLASLDEGTQDDLLDKICVGISANQLVAMYSKLSIAEAKMEAEKRGDCVEVLHDMLDVLRTTARQKLVAGFQDVATDSTFTDLLTDNGMDRALRDVILRDLKETVSKADFCHHAARIYQVLGDELLGRTVGPEHRHLLPYESSGRQTIEETKRGVLAIIKRRWLQMRPLASFDGLKDWALEEISSGESLHYGLPLTGDKRFASASIFFPTELEVDTQELLKPKTPEVRKTAIEVKPTLANAKTRITLKNLSEKTIVPQPRRMLSNNLGNKEPLQRRGATGVPIPKTRPEASPTIPHRQSQLHNSLHGATSTTGSLGVIRNSVTPSSSRLSTSIQRIPADATVNTGLSTTLLHSAGRRITPARSNDTPTAALPLRRTGPSGQGAQEATDPEPSTSTRIRSISSPAARGVNLVAKPLSPIASNKTTENVSKMPVPSRLWPGSTKVVKQAETTGRVAGAVARITANASRPLATPKAASGSVNSLRNAASSASLRMRERAVNVSETSPTLPESTTLRLPKQAAISTSSSSRTLLVSSNKQSSSLPVKKATGTPAASRSANIRTLPDVHSPVARKPITRLISRRTEPVTSSPKDQYTPVAPSRENRTSTPVGSSGSTTPATDLLEYTTCSNLSPRNAPVDKSSRMEPSSNALRPLRLVEKRNSIVNGLDEYAAAISKSSNTAGIATRTSELSLNAALPEVDSNVTQSVLSPLNNIETTINQESGDSYPARQKTRTPQYGSGLGALSSIENQGLQPKDTNIRPDTRTPSLSDKYHPASAFDPPSRIPSIFVAELSEEEEDNCIPYDESKGITLTIGIPCVISLNPLSTNRNAKYDVFGSSRSRLRAICRYIGLVDGMVGEWVGVEVNPASLNRIEDRLDSDDGHVPLAFGPHDGSWNDIRYYKIRADPPSSLGVPGRSVSRPASPLDLVGTRPWGHNTSLRHQLSSAGFAGVHGASPTISLQNRYMTSPGGLSSSTTLLPMDAGMSILSERSPESSWIAHVASGVESGTKCGLWVRPADVVFIPGAND